MSARPRRSTATNVSYQEEDDESEQHESGSGAGTGSEAESESGDEQQRASDEEEEEDESSEDEDPPEVMQVDIKMPVVSSKPNKKVKGGDSDDEDYHPGKSKQKSKTKKKKAPMKMKVQEEPAFEYDPDRPSPLASLPLEIISEITSYLAPEDLLTLLSTSKMLCTFLKDPSAKTLWTSARKNDTVPDLKCQDLTEWQHAALLVDQAQCQFCTKSQASVDSSLRRRACKECKKTNWVSSFDIPRSYPNLHPMTTRCALSSKIGFQPYHSGYPSFYILSDLFTLDAKLQKLQWLDDADRAKRKKARERERKKCKPRTATKGTGAQVLPGGVTVVQVKKKRQNLCSKESEIDDLDGKSRVEAFVLKRSTFVEQVAADEVELREAVNRKKSIVRQALLQRSLEQHQAEYERRESLKLKALSMNDKWLEWHFDTITWYRRCSTLLKVSGALTDEDWNLFELNLPHLFDDAKLELAKDASQSRKNARRQLLANLYKSWIETQAHQSKVFPAFTSGISELPSIRALILSDEVDTKATASNGWTTVDPSHPHPATYCPNLRILEAGFKAQLKEIERHSKAFQAEKRIAVIKRILAATGELPVEVLEDDSVTYGKDAYPDSFFEKPTSFLFCHKWHTRRSLTPPSTLFASWPELVNHEYHTHCYDRTYDFDLKPVTSSVLRGIIGAAGFDEDNVTAKDLDKLGHKFRWTNALKGSRKVHTWRSLLIAVSKQARTRKGIADTPIITFS